MTTSKREIILYINADDYAREAGEPLTDEKLTEIGQQVVDDAAGVYGLEGWEVK